MACYHPENRHARKATWSEARAAEIVEDLRAALEQFEAIQVDLAAGPAASLSA